MAACVQCGNRSAPGARWCNQCGTPVPDVSFAAPARHAADPQAPYDRPALLDTSPSSENSESTPTWISETSRPETPTAATPVPGAVSQATNLALAETPPPPPGTVPPPPPGPVPPPPPAGDTPPNTRPKDNAEDDGRRLRVILIAAGTVFLVVVVVALMTSLFTDDDGSSEPSETSSSADEGASTAVDVAGDATVDVPSTAPDGMDAEGATVSYTASNMTDGDPTTTWRTEGDATGEELSVDFPEPTTLSHVGMINGYAKVDPATGDERYGENRRVLTATWTFDDGTEVQRSLEESTSMQTFELGTEVETSSVTISIDQTSSPGGRDFTAISELSFLAS